MMIPNHYQLSHSKSYNSSHGRNSIVANTTTVAMIPAAKRPLRPRLVTSTSQLQLLTRAREPVQAGGDQRKPLLRR